MQWDSENIYVVETATDLPDVLSRFVLYHLLYAPIGLYYSPDEVNLVAISDKSALTSTTTALADITDVINTGSQKIAGYPVFNVTTGLPVWAVGNADGDVWNDATGATAHTPV